MKRFCWRCDKWVKVKSLGKRVWCPKCADKYGMKKAQLR